MRLWIPGRPYPQSRARVTRNGTFSSDGAGLRAWRATLEASALTMRRKTAVRPLSGPVSLSVLCLIPANDPGRWWLWCFVKPDFDNLVKPISDVLEKVGLFTTGDSQVADARQRKVWCPPGSEGVLIDLQEIQGGLNPGAWEPETDWLAPEKKTPTPRRRRGQGKEPEESP